MFCSPLAHPSPTLIPPVLRDWIGARLRGSPRGVRSHRHQACVFALGRIGDFVLTLSAMRLLVREWGPANCVLVVPANLAGLTSREFPEVEYITLPADAASLVREILPAWWQERGKFANDSFAQRICLSHQRGLFYETALSWIDADRDVRLMPETYPAIPADGWCTELLAHGRVVENALGRKVSREDILPAFESIKSVNDGRLLIYPLSQDPARTLPVSLVTDVLRHWRKRCNAPVVFGAGPSNRTELEHYAIAARLAGLTGIRIESPAGLDGLLDHLSRAGAVLASDSGPAHIATTLDKPAVILTIPGFYGYCQPWARSARQQTFLNDAPAEIVAAALPVL